MKAIKARINRSYCIIGIDTADNQLIEIAALKCVGRKKIDEFHSYIKNTIPFSIFERAYLTIDEKILQKKGRDLDIVMTDFKEFVSGSMILSWNTTVSILSVIEDSYLVSSLGTLEHPFMDLSKLSRIFFPYEAYYSLDEIAELLDIKYPIRVTNVAKNDARVIFNVFTNHILGKFLKREWDFESLSLLNKSVSNRDSFFLD